MSHGDGKGVDSNAGAPDIVRYLNVKSGNHRVVGHGDVGNSTGCC
jgi:hypothetical protein